MRTLYYPILVPSGVLETWANSPGISGPTLLEPFICEAIHN